MVIRPAWAIWLLSLPASICSANAQTCAFTLTPYSATATAQGGVGVFDVLAGSSSCARTATSTVDWIAVSFGQTGAGNGRVGYTVKPNTVGQSRQGGILLNSQAFTITQEAASCVFTITPGSQSVAATGGTFSIKIATTCTWTATASDTWIAIASPGTTGNGDLTFIVAPNTGASSRGGSIAIGSRVVPISQAGAGCGITLTLASSSVPSSGQTGMFTFMANAGCAATATPDVPWITAVVSGSAVTYTVAANVSAQARSGNILVGGQKFTINQAGGLCAFSIAPLTVGIPASGGIGKIDVATGESCVWTVQNNAAFASNVTAPASGPGSVTFSVPPNTASAGRIGTLTIAGQTATVSQAGVGVKIAPSGIVNGATFASGPISPGEIISIFGTGLGPAGPVALQVTADGESLTTALAGTRVLFDGVAAPMIFTSDAQISAVVPYVLAGATTQVQVEYQGTRSDPVAMNIAPSAPGIFTLSAGGKGAGAILNQDFSVNSATNRAMADSILMIYATGEGKTDPPGVDGKLTGDVLPQAALRVTVQIGGKDAEVFYAGGAPGLVAGLLQVNARVPGGVTGDNVPVTLRVGSVTSPAGVTVAIQ